LVVLFDTENISDLKNCLFSYTTICQIHKHEILRLESRQFGMKYFSH